MTFLTQGSGFTLDSSFEDFHPKRFGLTYSPPKIVLEYIVPSTGKLYHHNMRLTRLTPADDTGRWVEYLCRKHSMYLPASKVDRQQLHALVNKLKEHLDEGSEVYSDDDDIIL